MNTQKNQRVQQAMAAGAADIPPVEPTSDPTRSKGTTTPGVKAGQLFEKLTKLDADERAELANAPQSIRARFEEKRQKLISGADPAVRLLVERMRATNGG